MENKKGIGIPVEKEDTDHKEEDIQETDPGEPVKIMGQYGVCGLVIMESLRTFLQRHIHSGG